MFPWEHVAAGYVTFSLLVHLLVRRPPTGREAVVVAFASVLPDLVDKPLGWHYGVFESGYGVAHSVFVAVPLALAVLAVAASLHRGSLGLAFAVGYLAHPPGDLFQGYVAYGSVPLERVLWPVRTAHTDTEPGFQGLAVEYVREYLGELLSWPPEGYAAVALVLMGLSGLLWVVDGMPGVREPVGYLLTRA